MEESYGTINRNYSYDEKNKFTNHNNGNRYKICLIFSSNVIQMGFHWVDDMVAIFIYTERYSGGKAVNRLVKRAMERLVVTDVPFYFLYAYHRVSGITNLDTLKWIFNPSFYYTFIWIIESYFLPLIYSLLLLLLLCT